MAGAAALPRVGKRLHLSPHATPQQCDNPPRSTFSKSLRTKIFRCAISARKSTEHNLDLEFNSLDAQREAYE
jgi:hypothetical protein